jgi:hypothetical protein
MRLHYDAQSRNTGQGISLRGYVGLSRKWAAVLSGLGAVLRLEVAKVSVKECTPRERNTADTRDWFTVYQKLRTKLVILVLQRENTRDFVVYVFFNGGTTVYWSRN